MNVKRFRDIPTGSPPIGALNTCGIYTFSDFRPISCHIAQTPIGTRMQSVEWCHFQWPWVTPIPNFTVVLQCTFY